MHYHEVSVTRCLHTIVISIIVVQLTVVLLPLHQTAMSMPTAAHERVQRSISPVSVSYSISIQ